MSIPEEQSKKILLYCSKENLSLVVTWRVSMSINQLVLVKNWNMFFTRRFDLKYSFLLGQLIGGAKSGESRIIPIGAVSFVSISGLHDIEHTSFSDAKLLEEVKRGIQLTLEVYNKLDVEQFFHQPSTSQESNSSPPPLFDFNDSPTSDVPLISVVDNEPLSVKRSVDDRSVDNYEGEFPQLSSKRSKSEVDQKTYMGGHHVVSYSNLRSSDMHPKTTTLIFDNPNQLPLCKHCSLPISENPNISLKCCQCGNCFHRACSWGHFYVTSDPSNSWLCGKCLENHIVDVFDQEEKRWKSVLVLHYDEDKQIHRIKHNQSILFVHLNQYPVQLGDQKQLASPFFPHSLAHDSVIENRNGCRSYRAVDYFTGFSSNSHHSLPQILTFPTKQTSVSGITSVIQRRLGQNEQIELLVIPANKSILSAVWISQERISESVKKGLTSYFSYNLFSSPLWSTILNVAEEAFYYQEFSPILLPGMDLLSTNDISTDICCVCHNDDGKRLLLCDSCDSCFHMSCAIPKLKTKPTGKWFCHFCKAYPNDIDKRMHRDEMNCWFVGSAGKESSYKISLLPAGDELLKRQTREDDLTDHYVSLCEHDPRPAPLPTLSSLKLFNYHCDELHSVSPPHSLYYNQHLLSVMNMLSLYHIAHLLTTDQTDYLGYCSCVFHHFYQTNRLTGPILIITPSQRIPLWADSIHSYTFLKVAILSEKGLERKDQWAGFLGPPKGMYIGEYQVFLLPLSVYKNPNTFDKPYLSGLGVSLLVFDNIFADKTSVLSSFPSSHEAQSIFRHIEELKPSFMMFVYNFKQPCEMIPTSFVSQCSTLTDYLSKENPPRETDVNRLRKSLKDFTNPLTIPPSFFSFCFEEDYGRDSHFLECVHFVGISNIQRKCLEALYLRWQFLLRNFTKTPFNQDCLISLFLEMQRVFIHPMIAGCPDSMLTESTSWEDAFIQSSGKMLCLDYCLTCAKKNNSFIFTVYSRSLRFCHYLEKYYKKREKNVQCLFGVHTLQELKKVVRTCQQNAENRIFTVLILGTIPAGLSFQCPFIEEVFVHDTDMNPALDLSFMKSSFHIGNSSPVRVIYLLYASSFEVEYFIPNSKFLSHYSSFVNNKESRFCDYLSMYLLSHKSVCYSQFIQGTLNFVNVNAVKLLRLDTNHAFPVNMIEQLKAVIPAFQNEITSQSIEAIPPTPIQECLESLWTVCKTSSDVIRLCKRLIDMLPVCIQSRQSLGNLSLETLELCSQLDLLICHSLQRLADFNDDLPFDNETTIRKRMRNRQKNDYYNVVQPMYHILKVYLGRIRRARKFNNYWVIVPYQDIFRKL